MAIEREKKFSIGQKNFIAKFPNVGQLIDLESLKQALTNNRYGQMVMSGVASMYQALDLVDAIAFFQVVVPDVAKYYNIQNYANLDYDKAVDLVDAYQKQIKPWFDKTMDELKGLSDNGNATTEENI